MKRRIDPLHPIRLYFVDALAQTLHDQLGMPEEPEVEGYLTDLMVQFMYSEALSAYRHPDGQPLSLLEMMEQGDVRFGADSFDQEREVHRQIGDLVLFWTGLFPEALVDALGSSALVDYPKQGQYAYHVVSTFDHPPYTDEAPVFRRLSEGFVTYQHSLKMVRACFEGFARQGWSDGFNA